MLEQGTKLHEVFLSYSSADAPGVNELATRLKAQGLDVWFAPSNIQAGNQFPKEIETGLGCCQTVVVVLSKSSVESFWVRQEWEARLVQMSRDKTRKLIPLLLNDCEIPLLLSNFSYIDFRNVNFKDHNRFGDKILELVDSIRGALPPNGDTVVGIPFAVLAMTSKEAEELESRKIFDSPVSLSSFNEFAEILKQYGLGDFVHRYKEDREEWQPFETDSRTIRDIIEEVVDWSNPITLNNSPVIMRPQYYSQDFLSDNKEICSQTWQYLEHTGCVLVLDCISMFHPRIQKLFLMSQLGVGERVALVGISPANPSSIEINKSIENAAEEQLLRVFDRYNSSLDPQCIFEIGDERALSRWLYAILPRTIQTVHEQKANPAKRMLLRSRRGQPQGKSNLIYRMRK
jgi:hypothetical protein